MSALPFLADAARQTASLQELDHRPWPLPESPWVMGQTWEELLFAHWRVPVEELRAHVPDGLEVDTHDGEAWLGITPFRVSGIRLRGTLPLPRLSSFLELNVRTYVTDGGRPGIWFFSLDASSRFAVEVARLVYRLPYFHARMSAHESGGRIVFECVRREERGKIWSGSYRPCGEPFHAEPGSLEWFLAERYCLYTADERGIARAEIHHGLWSLQPAEAEIELNAIAPLEPPADEPILHFAERQDVVIWPLVTVL